MALVVLSRQVAAMSEACGRSKLIEKCFQELKAIERCLRETLIYRSKPEAVFCERDVSFGMFPSTLDDACLRRRRAMSERVEERAVFITKAV
jgi:hypothetical protein